MSSVALNSTSGQPSLKRSASTASLPTPPRTTRKRKNGRKLRLLGEEHEHVDSSDSEGGASRKKRRLDDIQEDDAGEDAFWMGSASSKTLSDNATLSDGGSKTHSPTIAREQTASPPPSPTDVPLLFRSKVKMSSSLVSPPPSTRKRVVAPKKRNSKQKTASTSPMALDSPNNPFLDSPDGDDAEGGDELSTLGGRPPVPDERPTVTYVFRGVRRILKNPDYDHEKNKPRSPRPESFLPIDHPDYEPDLRCPPKVLFPTKRKTRAKKAEPPKVKEKDPFSSDEEDDTKKDLRGNPLLMAPGAGTS